MWNKRGPLRAGVTQRVTFSREPQASATSQARLRLAAKPIRKMAQMIRAVLFDFGNVPLKGIAFGKKTSLRIDLHHRGTFGNNPIIQ